MPGGGVKVQASYGYAIGFEPSASLCVFLNGADFRQEAKWEVKDDEKD